MLLLEIAVLLLACAGEKAHSSSPHCRTEIIRQA